MIKIEISGYSVSEGTRTFEIMDRKQLEALIEEAEQNKRTDIYERTYRKAAGYPYHTGTAYTYIDARDGELNTTLWLEQNTIEHPYDSFYQIIICSHDSGNGRTEFDETDMLDEDEQKEFRQFSGSLEEFIEKTETDYDERLQNCIDYYAIEFSFDWEKINSQLDELYKDDTLGK